ncbi:hypothetical protein P174DRAFT_490760 [Aspergillus novofumigatus IBT 16806]|uniref:Uncharacterized protein n=1 Tax=Aspergillus novofumigatus (strain IBT 16806) TaxID=1392255 RepID=A0A2I1C7A4_ASPN1|nr:hypothetical protein P174DRAFT_490760 [Aspergillus novofumigatus IBT 16806]
MAPVGHADLDRCRCLGGACMRGACACIYIYIYMHTGVCVYGWMDATWRAMPTYVETDDHVRVSTSVRIWRARLSGADKGARRPTGHPRGARARPIPTPVSVCLYKCLSMARAPACRSAPPRAPANWSPAHPPPTRPRRTPAPARRLPPRQLGQPTGRRPPHRAPTCAPPLPPSLPRPLARARTPAGPRRRRPPVPMTVRARAALCSLRARAPRPNSPRPRPPRPPARAPPTALPLHIPTDLDRPPIVRANVPGSESRSGGGPLSLADRAPPTRPCAPANWPPPFVTRRRRARAPAAGQGARPAISDRQLAWSHGGWRSEGTGRRRSPRVSGEGCLAPSKRPALPDPLVGGVCQQI